MATPAEHYAKAEKYAAGVAREDDLDDAAIRVYLDLALIHATLATVPATVAETADQREREITAGLSA